MEHFQGAQIHRLPRLTDANNNNNKIIIKSLFSTTRVGIKYTVVSAITILLQILINCAENTLFYSIALQYHDLIQFIISLSNRINLLLYQFTTVYNQLI